MVYFRALFPMLRLCHHRKYRKFKKAFFPKFDFYLPLLLKVLPLCASSPEEKLCLLGKFSLEVLKELGREQAKVPATAIQSWTDR